MTRHDEKRAVRIRNRTRINREYRERASLLSNAALAEKFEIHKEHVSRIINGSAWPKYNSRDIKINFEDAELIRAAACERDRLKSLAAEHSHQKIADEEGVSLVLVNEISKGKKWRRLCDD